MTDLNLKSFDQLYPIMIRKYSTLIVDENASVIDKINSIVTGLNATGKLTNDVVKNWNTVMNWVMNDGLTTDVTNKINSMIADGSFNTLFNGSIGDITKLTTNDKSSLVNGINELETTKANQTDLNTANANITSNVIKIGDLTQLNTTDKTSIVNSVKEVKTQANANQSLINSLSSGSPKGVYATLSALQSAFPTGTSGIYVVSADGNFYYWNGSAWVSGGVYQATAIADGSITRKKLTYISGQGKNTKNLFDKDAITKGNQYVNWQTGALATATDNTTTYNASDWIPVSANTVYSMTNKDQSAFYDVNKNYISGFNNSAGYPIYSFTTPSNCAFIRVSVRQEYLTSFQLELGSSSTSYAPFVVLDPIAILDGDINRSKLDFFLKSKNLFNQATTTINKYVAWGAGSLSTPSDQTTTWYASDWISVNPSTAYTMTYQNQTAFYDVNKNYISGFNAASGNVYPVYTFTTPANAYYIRTTIRQEHLATLQVEQGSVATSYAPYGLLINITALDPDTQNVVNTYKNRLTPYKSIQTIMSNIVLSSNNTQIKLIGDSITAGLTGSGYATTGETIWGTNKVNVNGHCWANSLQSYLQSKFSNCTVKNYGVSGVNSNDLKNNLSSLIHTEDTIVICMIGTNDRNTSNNITKQQFYNNLLSIGDYVRGLGKDIIFMSSIPASVSNETDTTSAKSYHMEDVDHHVMKASAHYNQDYISLYKQFVNYCDVHNVTIDSLLTDGLHPTDSGYDVLFNLVSNSLGFGVKRPLATW